MSYLLWLGSVVDERTLLAGYAVSPAAVHWQHGFIRGLAKCGQVVRNVGHVTERAWPGGQLLPDWGNDLTPDDVDGQLVPYVNLPFARVGALAISYGIAIRQIVREHGRPRAVVSYNFYQPLALASLAAASLTRTPWIMISADRDPGPYGRLISRVPDGCVFLSYGEFSQRKGKRFHLDGGIEVMHQRSDPPHPPRIVYTGALTTGAGMSLLAEAFSRVTRPDVELWVSGKGTSAALERLAASDSRVRLLGLVSEAEREELCARASVFVNPRLPELEENRYNFPSKTLDYIAFGAPIVSTWTEGFSPEYRSLLRVSEASPSALAAAIDSALAMTEFERAEHYLHARHFAETSRAWPQQAARFLGWLDGFA